MTNSWRVVISRSLLLMACVACACDDSEGTSEASGGSTSASDSTTGGASTDTGIATAPPGSTDTGIATTPPGSTDTGIATTPPGSTDTGIATTPPETDGSSSGATSDEGTAVVVSYSFVTEVAGVPLDCESAGASWVDVTVMDTADPDDTSFDVLDLDCDDQTISLGSLPAGNYTVAVVAWDQALWFGEAEPLQLDGTERQVELLVPLTEEPIE